MSRIISFEVEIDNAAAGDFHLDPDRLKKLIRDFVWCSECSCREMCEQVVVINRRRNDGDGLSAASLHGCLNGVRGGGKR